MLKVCKYEVQNEKKPKKTPSLTNRLQIQLLTFCCKLKIQMILFQLAKHH